MEVIAGALLKRIREEIFETSIREFAEFLNMHYTTYHNYERNKFGRSPFKIFFEISNGLSKVIIRNVSAKSKLKDVVTAFFLAHCPGFQDCNYLINGDLSTFENILEYLEYSLHLAFNEENSLEKLESQLNFHSQRRYCINKVLEFSKIKEVLLIGHVEDYNIHLQVFKDNFSKDIAYCLGGLNSEIEKLITEFFSNHGVQNFEFIKEDYTKYVKYNKLSSFVFVCYQFHHIQRTQDKLEFLKNIYKNLPKGGYLCILDPFFDDYDLNHENFNNRWSMLVQETEIKKFWTSLKSFDPNAIATAKEIAEKSRNAEKKMGENYMKATNGFLISFEWLKTAVEKIGFKIIIKQRTNCFSDAIFLLQK